MGIWDSGETVVEEAELTTGQSIALSMVKQALIDEDYGPFDNIVSIEPGHTSDDGSTCNECGRITSQSPEYQAMEWREKINTKICHEQAEWVIDVFYESFENGTIYRAIYGVPREGKPSCWAS